MGYAATILADSISGAGDRLTTMQVTFPRMVLAEFNTHRMFSRNSASSRAIPLRKQIERIQADPFIPSYWGANQSGMQAREEIDAHNRVYADITWRGALHDAIAHAEALGRQGVHKQLASRLLEPFMWHTVIVSATEWSNFFALRDNEMAQPEIQTIAHMMRELYEGSQPTLIRRGEWHLPLIQPEERDGVFEYTERARQISAARCARVSYLTHDGRRDLDADVELYSRLVHDGHMSALEHTATPVYRFSPPPKFSFADTPWGEAAQRAEVAAMYSSMFHGNFRGWKQLRKFVPNEHDFGLHLAE